MSLPSRLKLPKTFYKNVLITRGSVGRVWLDSLENLVASLSDAWQLTDLCIMENLTYNFVVRATSALFGMVVLKISIPGNALAREWAALERYDGHAAVKVIAYDLEKGAFLLESLEPGRLLKTLFPGDDEQATTIAGTVIKQLQMISCNTSDKSNFLTLDQWYAPLFKHTHKEIPTDSYVRARRWATDLLEMKNESILAHGDLHHDNILQSNRGWLAIDPKGVCAFPGFDVGAFMRNPFPELLTVSRPGSIIGRRFDQFSQLLSEDREILVRLSYVQTVLSACWALDDKLPTWKQYVSCADLIYDH